MLKPEIVFTDHMVLQRNKRIRIFGEAEDNKEVSVTICRNKKEYTYSSKAVEGRFEVILPALKATSDDESLTMIITDGESSFTYKDIAVGEVFLAGGQSNMELELQNAEGGKEILNTPLEDKDLRSRLRYFYTPKISYKGLEESKEAEAYEKGMREAEWKHYSKENAAAWSAVGYFFALKLAKELKVTIGIIGCNWGGTTAACWMSKEYLLKKESTKCYIEDYENSEAYNKPEEEQVKDYEQYQIDMAKWDKEAAKVYAVEPMIAWVDLESKIGKCPYPGPLNCANFTRPSGLFETMVKRVAPYTLAGVIYYQGESDENKPELYYDLQTSLIDQWRDSFKDEELPFIITQLPMHRYQHDPDTKSWCTIRQAQLKAFRAVKNTGIAVIIDCGKFHEIHPPKKNKVGKRLALQALNFIYNKIKDEKAFGPIYKDYLIEKDGIRIYFDYAKDGFVALGKKNIGFEIASDDNKFVEAKFDIMKDGSILLYSKKVKNPTQARYLWSNYAEVFLFGANGLPVAPFKTY